MRHRRSDPSSSESRHPQPKTLTETTTISQVTSIPENDTVSKKPWIFKFKKPNFKKGSKASPTEDELPSISLSSPEGNTLTDSRGTFTVNTMDILLSPPSSPYHSGFSLSTLNLNDDRYVQRVNVHEGDPATLAANFTENAARGIITWTKSDSRIYGRSMHDSSYRWLVSNDKETSKLTISETSLDDSGVYTCETDDDLAVTFFLLVVGKPSSPSKPCIVRQTGTTVSLRWDPPVITGNMPITAYTVELAEQGVDLWQVVVAYCPNCYQNIEDLTPGQIYRFRISANNEIGISEPGESSDPIVMPDIEEHRRNSDLEETMVFWKSGFDKDYSEVLELGRGRFAVVKHCVRKSDGKEVAVKMINKKKAAVECVQNEFLFLQSLQHHALIQGLDTYQSQGCYVLVIQMVPGKRLFAYICDKSHYDEEQVRYFMRQLLDAVQYLHNCRIVHLDLKPENLLVDVSHFSPQLKLIDFGDAKLLSGGHLYIHPLVGNPEFAAPEVVSGSPISLFTDMWSVGVILYIFLSGASPYLDDSIEETCSNIIRNDFSFPIEYFSHISASAQDLIQGLLVTNQEQRFNPQICSTAMWIRENSVGKSVPTTKLASFIDRRKHQ